MAWMIFKKRDTITYKTKSGEEKEIELKMALSPFGDFSGDYFYNPDVMVKINNQDMGGGKMTDSVILMYLTIEGAKKSGDKIGEFELIIEGPALVAAKRKRVSKDRFELTPFTKDGAFIGPACPPVVIPESVEVIIIYKDGKFELKEN